MKKSIKRGLVLVLALAMLFALTACGSSPAKDTGDNSTETSEKTYTLTCANFYASINDHGITVEQWIEEIEERSNGRLQIDYFPGGSLLDSASMYDGILNGSADMGVFDTSTVVGVFNHLAYFAIPHGYTNGYVASMTLNDFINEYNPEELSKVHVLYAHCVSPQAFITTKEIRTPHDVDGLVLRVGNDLHSAVVSALGGTTYSCQVSEMYEAMQKGIIDGAYTGTDTLTGFSLAEVAKYVIHQDNLGKVGTIVFAMNNDKWNSLPADLQQIITDVSNEMYEAEAKAWYHSDLYLEGYFESLGGTIITIDEENSKAFSEILDPVVAKYAENTGVPAETMAAYDQFIAERIEYWDGNLPSEDAVNTWYEENIAPFTVE